MSRRYPWSLLGIAETQDVKAIRKAYADAIKAMDLDADITGYSNLRAARDMALRLAKNAAPVPQGIEPGDEALTDTPSPPEPVEAASEPPARWQHAAPDLAGDWQPDARLSTPAPTMDANASFEGVFTHAALDAGRGEAIPLPWDNGLSPPLLQGYGPMEAAIGLTPGQSAFERLAELLDPENPDIAGIALSDAEEIVARRAQRAVIDEARQANVSQQGRIEIWLAERLADAWPRSAPLLEEATETFGWEREWGRFDARPVIEYLGARLRGYRFQSKVMQPGHRFHKAWNELSRPGKAGPLRFLRASTGEVQGLLAGVRKHFPELEDHFDPQRVASWEHARAVSATTIVMLILFGLLAIAIATSDGSRSGSQPGVSATGDPLAPAVVQEDTLGPSATKAAQAAVTEAFGEGHDLSWLWKNQPDLAQTITSNARLSLRAGEDEEAVVRKVLEIVRERVYRNGRLLSGADLDTTMRIRLGQLKAARKLGPDACGKALNSSWLDASVPVPDTLRAQERSFAAALADKSLLKRPEKSQGSTASVPGALVGKVIDMSGLPEARVRKAMSGSGSEADSCAVSIALLEATLDWKGDGRKAILLTL